MDGYAICTIQIFFKLKIEINIPISFFCSHDFIGEFTTSYRELSRGQSQFNVYEVSVGTVLATGYSL